MKTKGDAEELETVMSIVESLCDKPGYTGYTREWTRQIGTHGWINKRPINQTRWSVLCATSEHADRMHEAVKRLVGYMR
jgi:hypothetical protein